MGSRYAPLAGLVVAVLLARAAGSAGAPPLVKYGGDRLTVHAEKVPVARLLEEVGRVTGAAIRGDPPAHEVTVDLDDVAVGDALARLLGSENFALRYGADGRLRTIELLGGPSAALAWPPLVAEPAGPLGEAEEERQRAVMGRPVQVSGRLAAALGTQRPAAGQLIQVALQQKSGKVRAEAQDQVIAAFRRDPEIEATFTTILAPIDDANLARVMRNIGGDRGGEFLARLAAEAQSPELRAKAAGALEAFRKAGRESGGHLAEP